MLTNLTGGKSYPAFLSFLILCFIHFNTSAQNKIKSVPFEYAPEIAADPYNQRVKQNILTLSNSDFIVLTRKAATSYIIAYFSADLKKLWQTPVSLKEKEEIEAFNFNTKDIILLTQNSTTAGKTVSALLLDLKTGKKSATKKVLEAPAKSRRLGCAISPDGSKIIAYQYYYQDDRLIAINASQFDGSLTKITDRTYNLRDLTGILSANVQLANNGDQYVSLITHNATKLSVRRYNNKNATVNGMDVPVGGLFDGKKIYVFDANFTLQPDGNMYAAVISADEKTGNYHSLKVVKFDFTAGDLRYAPEFLFSPEYLAQLNKVPADKPVKRLEDIYLSEIVIGPEGEILVVAEKKFNEGPKLPYKAQEMHLFGYDEYLNPKWHSVLNKNQTATASEGFSTISYKSKLLNTDFQVITLETLNGKTDLYLREINLKNGVSAGPKPVGLTISTTESFAYVKDFTSWLNEKNLVSITKSSKKPFGYILNKITVK